MHDLTFGSAYPVLAQVAMTRVLYRQYLCGEISQEQWAYRKRQPYINEGPLSLRPYLNKTWFSKGGGAEFVACTGLFFTKLPFMTLGTTAGRQQHVLSDGVPSFSDLLGFDRFLHRTMLVKRQTREQLSHPLFFELAHARHLAYVEHMRHHALRWMQRAKTDAYGNRDEDKVLAVMDIPRVHAHGGSSVVSSTKYPYRARMYSRPTPPYHIHSGYVTPPSPAPFEDDTTPRIVVEDLMTRARIFPEELYPASVTSHGRMSMYVYFDGNVFEKAVIEEWLEEVKEAVLWYLGQTHQPRLDQQSVDGETGRGQTIQAEL